MKDKNELLSKLKKLAEQGIDGEQEQAKKMFDKLCKKYNIDGSKVDTESVQRRTFTFKEKDKKLLLQIIYKVLNKREITYYIPRSDYSNRYKRTKISIYCTEEQEMQINFLFEFYTELYEQELKLFFQAFILKHELHHIFSDVSESDSEPEQSETAPQLSLDELERINAMMYGMSDKSPTLRITSGEVN